MILFAVLLGQVQFIEVPASSSRIAWTHDNLASPAKHLPETVGAGVAVVDFDGDGWPDLYFVNSGAAPGFAPKKPLRNALYRNNRDGTFTDVTERAGVAGGKFGMGAAAADYDGDGRPDLLVTNFGSLTLYRNRGDGTFAEVTAEAGLDAKGWFTHAVWFDYDRDGRLDLFVSGFVQYDAEQNRFCGDPEAKRQHYCIPRMFRPSSSRLYRNEGGGRFRDVSGETGISAVEGKSFGAVAADINNDGWPDLFVANDTLPNFLFVNQQGKRFVENGLVAGVAYSEGGNPRSGMGVDAADVDADGWLDLFVANIDQEMFSLYRNLGGAEFADDSAEIRRATRLLSGWGLRFADFDNDGDLDLFLVNGHPDDMVSEVKPLVTFAEPMLFFSNDGGKFQDVSASSGEVFAKRIPGRGMATLDFDNDGDLDVIVTNNGAPPMLLRNDGGNRHLWVGLELIATSSNAAAEGAIIAWCAAGKEYKRQRTAGGSYLSSHDPREILGAGAAESIDWIEVRWPSGKADRIEKPKMRTYIRIVEGGAK
jgi:hypothetical protein